MKTVGKTEKVIVLWEKAASDALEAIEKKDFVLMKEAWRAGNLCFKEITACLGTEQVTSSDKERFVKLSKQWKSIADKIENWKDEIKKEINRYRKIKRKGSKVSRIYKYRKAAGGNLKLKAR